MPRRSVVSDLPMNLGPLVDKIRKPSTPVPDLHLRQAEVTARSLASGFDVTIKLAGSTATIGNVKSLIPLKVGDIVWVAQQGGMLLVVGKIQTLGLGELDVLNVATTLAGGTPAGGSPFFLQGGTNVYTTDVNGFSRITFPTPFPNGLVSFVSMNGDFGTGSSWIHARGMSSASYADVRICNDQGTIGVNVAHRYDWIALGW